MTGEGGGGSVTALEGGSLRRESIRSKLIITRVWHLLRFAIIASVVFEAPHLSVH